MTRGYDNLWEKFCEDQEALEKATKMVKRLRAERDAANEQVAEMLDAVEMVRNGLKRIDRLQEEAPVADWDEKLRVYLDEVERQGDAATTLKNRTMCLTPWVEWLKLNGGRPSNQRIKNYLKSRKDLARSSFKSMGKVIEDFCNDSVDFEWERVRCPRVHGHRKEKPTLAMPTDMLDAVSKLVTRRMLSFGEEAEKVKTEKEATQLVKDLGK